MVTVGQIHEFNTGRLYTEEGQVIRWRVVDGRTQFFDCSRGIWGTVPYVCSTDRELLSRYDSGIYEQGGLEIFNALKRPKAIEQEDMENTVRDVLLDDSREQQAEYERDAQNDLIEMARGDRESTEDEQRAADAEWARIESMMLHGE